MSLVIKKHAHTRASTAEIFRGIAKLSDGKFAVLTFNSNITAKSGSSSEKNDTPKLYVTVYNSDWTTFLSAGIQVGTAKTKQTLGEIASMAIDSSNNIHIAYIYRTSPDNSSRLLQGQSLRYRKITYNGTTLSIGSESTVYSITGYYTGVDIEVPLGATLNDNPLIGFVHTVDGAIHKTRLTQLSVGSTTQIESVTSAGRGVSIALNNTVNTASYKWLAATYQLEAGNDVGDAIVYGTGTTTSAPVISTILAQNLNVGLGDGLRHIAAFRTGNVFIITGPVAANPYTHFVASYAIPVSGSPAITLSPQNISVGDKYVANAGYLFAGVQLDATDGAIITHISDGKNIYAQVLNYSIDVGETALTLVKQDLKWKMDQHYLGKNVAPSLLYTGDRSRNGTSDIGVIVDYPDAYLYVLYNREPASGKITTVMTTPATNGSINKSNPTIVAQVSGSSNNNIVGAVDFQTSKDANFITEVHDFLSDYQTFLKSVSVKINLPEASLSQGQFYSRMRIVDQLGYAYDWNTVQPFTSAHKPTAAILSPERGAVAIYNGDGTVTFNIGFTDPDSTDSQTAYRIQVTDLSGTVIADTGKIVSNAATINVTMSSSNLNADLIVNAWVWDEDDVMSDPTSSDFMLATLPSVLMDYPLVNTAVTTATPVYSWNDTLPAGRTQEKYRIFVRKAVDNSLIWDSGILDGDGDTLQQEAGYLKNSTNYAVTVWIEDNIGMTASNSVTFPTLWVKPPACTSPYVDISLYDELGYAYVTMVPPTVSDLAHTKIALMRRSLFSNSDWELIEALQMGVGLNYSVIDSTLPSGVDTFYAAVLQVDTGGDLSIGDPDDSGQMKISTPSGRYWLVSLDNPENNTIIPIVTSDSYSDERESETIVIVDRGRWIDVGDDIGVTGTLNSKIYNRDVGLGNNPVMNYLHNPRLLSTGVGLTGIASWTLANANYITRRTYSPCPVGKEDCIAFGMTGTFDASISQVVSRTAGIHSMSVWIENSYIVSATGKIVTLSAECKDASGTTLVTYSNDFPLLQSGSAMIIADALVTPSIISDSFNWYRLNYTFTAPTGTASITMKINLNADAGDYLTIGGAMLIDSGNINIKYFDGDTNGAEWMEEDKSTASFTAGKVTARAARRRIERIVKETDTFYLRNPFGDVWKVEAGEIQVDRVAGTGQDEFVTLTIPYLEIG